MAQKPPPSNVVPFRRPESPGGGGFRLPAWVPRELVGTATGAIVLANLAVWLVMIGASFGAGVLTPFPPAITWAFGSLVPELVPTEPWRLLTSTFIHADIGHIAMNLAILWFTGRQLERAYGPGRLVALYVAACLTGSIFSMTWHLLVTPGNSVGASGGVLGVVAGLAAFFWRATGRKSDPTKQWLWFCGLGLVVGVITSSMGMAVDNAAHLGGMTGGAAVSWLFAGRPAFSSRLTRGLLGGSALLVATSFGLALALGYRPDPAERAPGPRCGEEGAEAFTKGDFALSESKLAEAIELAPRDPSLRLLRGGALRKLGRTDEATAELDVADSLYGKLRAAAPDAPALALGHANVLRLLGRTSEATDALLSGAKGRGGSGETYASLAVALEELGYLEEARLAAAKGRIVDTANPQLREIHERIKDEIAHPETLVTPAPTAAP